jgi:hypothetical protein
MISYCSYKNKSLFIKIVILKKLFLFKKSLYYILREWWSKKNINLKIIFFFNIKLFDN